MPCFNAEPVLERTLEDFADQTHRDFELIIVNDGSTDRSEAVAKDFINRKNLPWKLVTQPNKGISAARNRGMSFAKGEHIVFCDCDDRFENSYLSELHGKAVEDGSDAVFCAFDLVNKENIRIKRVKRRKLFFSCEKTGPELLSRFLLKDRLAIQMARVLFKTDLLRKNGVTFDENLHNAEDQLFICMALFHAEGVSCIDRVLYHYVQYPGQSTKSPQKNLTRANVEMRMFGNLVSFLKGNGADEKLTRTIENCEVPNAVIKDLSLSLRFGKESYYWERLGDSECLEKILKTQSVLCFLKKPETWFKGFEILHCPKLFLRYYLNKGMAQK
jgi:glycosyltransferase EpsJ